MTTTHRDDDAVATTRSGIAPRRGPAAALAIGALLVGAALTLHLRGGAADEEAFVRRIADDPQTWLTGHVLMGVGGVVLMLGLLAVPGLVRGRGRRAVLVGAGMSAVGAASTALGDFAHGSLAYVLVEQVSAEQSVEIQDQFFTTPLLAAASMPGLLLPLGLLVLGAGLLYSRAVPQLLAVLLLVAPIAVQLGYMVTSLPMPLMVMPMVVGMGWLAMLLARGAETAQGR